MKGKFIKNRYSKGRKKIFLLFRSILRERNKKERNKLQKIRFARMYTLDCLWLPLVALSRFIYRITAVACFAKGTRPFDSSLSSSKRAAKPLSIFWELVDLEHLLQNLVIHPHFGIIFLAEKCKEVQGKTWVILSIL